MTVDRPAISQGLIKRAREQELRAWLLTQSRQVAPVMGTRIALRLVPLLLMGMPGDEFGRKQRHWVVMAFRQVAVGLCSTISPCISLYHACTTFNTVSFSTKPSVIAAMQEASGAGIMLSSSSNPDLILKASSSRASYGLRWASVLKGEEERPWEEAAADRAWISAGGTAEGLLKQPLWLNNMPTDQPPEPYLSHWRKLKSCLLEDDPSWHIWTDWYEERLAVKPLQSDEIEMFRLTAIENAHVKMRDTSKQGQLTWKEELKAQEKLLRNDSRKANRIIARFIETRS